MGDLSLKTHTDACASAPLSPFVTLTPSPGFAACRLPGQSPLKRAAVTGRGAMSREAGACNPLVQRAAVAQIEMLLPQRLHDKAGLQNACIHANIHSVCMLSCLCMPAVLDATLRPSFSSVTSLSTPIPIMHTRPCPSSSGSVYRQDAHADDPRANAWVPRTHAIDPPPPPLPHAPAAPRHGKCYGWQPNCSVHPTCPGGPLKGRPGPRPQSLV